MASTPVIIHMVPIIAATNAAAQQPDTKQPQPEHHQHSAWWLLIPVLFAVVWVYLFVEWLKK